MPSIDPKTLSIRDRHHHLLNGIGPRPIAWVTTVDKKGAVNLAPYSFFNLFSSNPPILIFSPARRGRDNTTKHTLENVLETMECVVNIVSYPLLRQMVLTSQEFDTGTNEMEKAGLEPVASTVVTPPRVAASPMQLECKVLEVKSLGTEGASGNLVMAEVVMIHIQDDLLGENGFLDQTKVDLVGRMGENWYSRAHGSSIFQVDSDVTSKGVGFMTIPDTFRRSKRLSANDLAELAMVSIIPDETEVNDYKLTELSELFITHEDSPERLLTALEDEVKSALARGDHRAAWSTVLAYNG